MLKRICGDGWMTTRQVFQEKERQLTILPRFFQEKWHFLKREGDYIRNERRKPWFHWDSDDEQEQGLPRRFRTLLKRYLDP